MASRPVPLTSQHPKPLKSVAKLLAQAKFAKKPLPPSPTTLSKKDTPVSPAAKRPALPQHLTPPPPLSKHSRAAKGPAVPAEKFLRWPYWTVIGFLAFSVVALAGVFYQELQTDFLGLLPPTSSTVSPTTPVPPTPDSGTAAGTIPLKSLDRAERRPKDLPFTFNIPAAWNVFLDADRITPGVNAKTSGVFLRIDSQAIPAGDLDVVEMVLTGTSFMAGTALAELENQQKMLDTNASATKISRTAKTLNKKSVGLLQYTLTTAGKPARARSYTEYYVEDLVHGVAYMLRIVATGHPSYAPYTKGAQLVTEFERSFKIDS